jgi:hypothetical protein
VGVILSGVSERQVIGVAGPAIGKELPEDLSYNKAHSIPASAAKKALFVSFAEVPKFISFWAIARTPSAIDKRIAESVTAKSITNPERPRPGGAYGAGPLFIFIKFLICNFIFSIFTAPN